MDVSGIGQPYQWGFKEERSTEGLLLYVIEHWKEAMDNDQYVGYYLQFSKRHFGNVNKDILKRKLQAARFCCDGMGDYLSQRMHYAEGNGKKLTIRQKEFGVPQGSLLGPRQFSIHVNDLTDSITRGELVMFPDDASLYCTYDNIEDVIDSLNASARELLDWCNRNQLRVIQARQQQ